MPVFLGHTVPDEALAVAGRTDEQADELCRPVCRVAGDPHSPLNADAQVCNSSLQFSNGSHVPISIQDTSVRSRLGNWVLVGLG